MSGAPANLGNVCVLDMRVDLCADVCADVRVDVRAGRYEIWVDIRVDMCVGTCMGTCICMGIWTRVCACVYVHNLKSYFQDLEHTHNLLNKPVLLCQWSSPTVCLLRGYGCARNEDERLDESFPTVCAWQAHVYQMCFFVLKGLFPGTPNT